MHFLGYNFRLTDIQCALGLSQLNKLDSFLARRRLIVAQYNRAFSLNKNIITPPDSEYGEPAWHLYVVRLKEGLDKTDVVHRLQEEGIGSQVHYMPVYRHPYYQSLNYNPENYPYAEAYYRQALSIPLFPAMSDDDVQRVIRAVSAL